MCKAHEGTFVILPICIYLKIKNTLSLLTLYLSSFNSLSLSLLIQNHKSESKIKIVLCNHLHRFYKNTHNEHVREIVC
ncbi:hypothetical protein Hanom_Chr07g00610501 [Helianthus anomalus]